MMSYFASACQAELLPVNEFAGFAEAVRCYLDIPNDSDESRVRSRTAVIWRSFGVGVQTKDSPQYEIKAYRCMARGYLESYAL